MHKEYLIDWSLYACGANSEIYSHYYKRMLKGTVQKDGYVRVSLMCIDGKIRKFLWHRVIYTYFYGTIPEDMEINHISEVKTDNRLSNLECISHLANIRYGTGIERHAAKTSVKLKGVPRPHVIEQNKRLKSKPVVAVDKNGVIVMEFASTQEAGRNGFTQGCVADCCNNCYGKLGNYYKGYYWYYLEDYLKIKGVA